MIDSTPIENNSNIEPIPSVDKPETNSPSSSHHTLILPTAVGALVLMMGLIIGLMVMKKPQDLRSKASNNIATLAINPSTKSLSVGQTTSLGITMNTGVDTVSIVEIHLAYDPTAIEVSDFTPGTALPTILAPAAINQGTLTVLLGSKLVLTPTTHLEPFNGSAIIGTFKIKLLANKSSSISFAGTTTVAAIGKNTNALASSAGSTITVAAAQTPTLTPTHIPNATNTPTPTRLPSPTRTPTPTPTRIPTPTPTHIPGATNTPTPINTITPTKIGTMPSIPSKTPIPTQSSAPLQYVTPSPIPENTTSQNPEVPNDNPTEISVQDYSPFSDVPQPEISNKSLFDQIFTSILDFFKTLFTK